MKKEVRKDVPYPRSRNDFNCVLVNRRGSPMPSIATASNSSNGGAMNKSRKLIGRHLFRIFCNWFECWSDDGCCCGFVETLFML